MTSPHDPSDDQYRHPEDRPDFPSYPSTPHPQDNLGQSPYPYQGYAGYSAGYGADHGAGYGQPQQGTGRVSPVEAVSWAFRTVFRNWQIWLLGALVAGVLTVALSLIIDLAFGGASGGLAYQDGLAYQGTRLLFMILAQALGIVIYAGALRQVDRAKITWGDFTRDINFGPAFGVAIVIQIASGLLLAAVLLFFFIGGNDIVVSQMASQDELLAALSSLFAALGIVLLLALLVAPLTMFMVWFALDRRTGFAGAFGAGFRAGARNYLPLLLFNLVAGLASTILAVMTFGVALIVLVPALLLAQAHMFRQAAEGPLPAQNI